MELNTLHFLIEKILSIDENTPSMDSGSACANHLLQRLDSVNRPLRGRPQSCLTSTCSFQYRRILLSERFDLLLRSYRKINVGHCFLFPGLFSAILQSSARSIALPIDQLKFSYEVLDNITDEPPTVSFSPRFRRIMLITMIVLVHSRYCPWHHD